MTKGTLCLYNIEVKRDGQKTLRVLHRELQENSGLDDEQMPTCYIQPGRYYYDSCQTRVNVDPLHNVDVKHILQEKTGVLASSVQTPVTFPVSFEAYRIDSSL